MSGSSTTPPNGGVRLRALGLRTGWEGLGWRDPADLPADARAAAGGRGVLSLGVPAVADAGVRRATRECRWALAAVEAMLEDENTEREAIAGAGTALLYVTAASYGASNRAFIEGGGGTHFAYTAPAVVPAEVAIAYGIGGPTAIYIGGGPATLRAIWQAAALIGRGACERALVLTVETFEECADLYARARHLVAAPIVEAAGCLWLEPGGARVTLRTARDAGGRGRGGELAACGPLAELARRRRAGGPAGGLHARWQGEHAELLWTEKETR